jgi:hypothetical protein
MYWWCKTQYSLEMIGNAQPLADNWQITFGWQTAAHLFSQPVSNFSKF